MAAGNKTEPVQGAPRSKKTAKPAKAKKGKARPGRRPTQKAARRPRRWPGPSTRAFIFRLPSGSTVICSTVEEVVALERALNRAN
jgi:hypothetical protein